MEEYTREYVIKHLTPGEVLKAGNISSGGEPMVPKDFKLARFELLKNMAIEVTKDPDVLKSQFKLSSAYAEFNRFIEAETKIPKDRQNKSKADELSAQEICALADYQTAKQSKIDSFKLQKSDQDLLVKIIDRAEAKFDEAKLFSKADRSPASSGLYNYIENTKPLPKPQINL